MRALEFTRLIEEPMTLPDVQRVTGKVDPQLAKAIDAAVSKVQKEPNLLQKFKNIAKLVASKINSKQTEDQQQVQAVDQQNDPAVLGMMMKKLLSQTPEEQAKTMQDPVLRALRDLVASQVYDEVENYQAQYDTEISNLAVKLNARLSFLAKQVGRTMSTTDEQIKNALETAIRPIFRDVKQSTIRDANAQKELLGLIQMLQVGVIDSSAFDKDKGNIKDLVPDTNITYTDRESGETKTLSKSVQQMLDQGNMFEKMMKAIPGATAGNWGPGEIGLVLLFNPATKGTKGDIQFATNDAPTEEGGKGDVTDALEIKASSDPKAGGRLSPKGGDKESIVKAFVEKVWKNYFPNENYVKYESKIRKTAKGKSIAGYNANFTQTGFLHYNELFYEYGISPDQAKDILRRGFLLSFNESTRADIEKRKDLLEPMLNAVMVATEDSPDLVNHQPGKDAVYLHKGQTYVDSKKWVAGYMRALYTLYKESSKSGEYSKILVINPGTGNFAIFKDAETLEKYINDGTVMATGGLEFNLTQTSKSAQLGIA